ncbi:MAG: 7,8-dihydropterin-6-yl-methyl-4-(beta-D-ribofuranosyl)aminobenzene 5'-phosphate synthase [Desulforhopalus sp.]|jgi:7,8-dihydropterin-6-yl-methyl-4-(beta-D-ribofuranosyl)aminobenzene 5'-phosphate synthase
MKMSYRISPAWWPIIGLLSPVLFPWLFVRNRHYKHDITKSLRINKERIERARPLELPQLEKFELTVLVEQKADKDFLSAPGVSYLIKTDLGSLLFDVGYGPEDPSLAHNAKKLHFKMDQVDAVAISHFHPDHMGGIKAVREKNVTVPQEIGGTQKLTCFLPAEADAGGGQTEVVEGAQMLAAGVATTGPLTRSLFLMGWTEEQAIVARLKNKGLVVFTGCGHPTIEVILEMVKQLSDEPIYAIGGGLHFPVTDSPFQKLGIKVQMILGTGKPPWKRITDDDLKDTIDNINAINPKYVFLSAHDTCDYAIDRFKNELNSETSVLRAGATYQI